jgi:hypothetical protein
MVVETFASELAGRKTMSKDEAYRALTLEELRHQGAVLGLRRELDLVLVGAFEILLGPRLTPSPCVVPNERSHPCHGRVRVRVGLGRGRASSLDDVRGEIRNLDTRAGMRTNEVERVDDRCERPAGHLACTPLLRVRDHSIAP